MGSLGDSDDEIQPVKRKSNLDGFDNNETQPFDSQFSPHSATGEEFEGEDFDGLQFLQSTLPFVDTAPLEDAFETQFMNFAGETQVLDDPDVVENVGTQLLHESDNEVIVDTDSEGIDITDVLGDTEELSDHDSVKGVGSYPEDEENKLSTPPGKQDNRGLRAQSDGLSNKQHIPELDVVPAGLLPDRITPESKPGSAGVNFTSVRAAALRASGLAARSRASKVTNSESCFIKNGGWFSKQDVAEDIGISGIRDSSVVEEEVEEDFLGEYSELTEGLRGQNNCRADSSTVRRLFTEDTLAEVKEHNDRMDNADGGAELPQFHACGNAIAGLSYIDSQEPGELSQANAIGFVDRYIKSDVMDFDKEVELGRSTGGKSKPVSSTKGTQSMIKRTNQKITAGERGIFDWDDNCEDEGGGEFFTKKKEAFFDSGGQRQRSVARKLGDLGTKGSGAVDDTRDEEERPDIHQKLKSSGISNSGLVLHKRKRNEKKKKVTKTNSKRKLAKELEEQLNTCSSDGMEATCTDEGMPEMLSVGFDTQMAAEAMETLCSGLGMADHDSKDTEQGAKNIFEGFLIGERKKRSQTKKDGVRKTSNPPSSGVSNRNSKQTDRMGSKSRKKLAVSSLKRAKIVRKEEGKKSATNAEGRFSTNWIGKEQKVSSEVFDQVEEEKAHKSNDTDAIDRCHLVGSSSPRVSVQKWHLQEQLGTCTPIARRTRQCRISNQSKEGVASYDSGEKIHLAEAVALDGRRGRITGSDAHETLSSKEKFSELGSTHSGELENVKLTEQEKSHGKLTDAIAAVRIGPLSYKRGKRTNRKLSTKLIGSGDLHGSVNQSVGQGTNGQSLEKLKGSQINAVSNSVDLSVKRKAPPSASAGPVLRSSHRQSDGSLFLHSTNKGGSGNVALECSSVDPNVIPKNLVGAFTFKLFHRNSDADTMSANEGAEASTPQSAVSPGDRCKPYGSASTTPLSCTTPVNAASPICMGDEYFKQSCRKNLTRSLLAKEINSLISNGAEPTSSMKDSRRRRDMASVQALFSHHLDEDTIKQQKKILARLGASVASSIAEATHFITDKFVRTRNMLEAIAFGKPVVNHLWLESCGQASCFIDERNYILRDAKKEKEFGFSLPVSLARACQRPLLKGQKVLITPNTKPGKEILTNLVKAVHGLALQRIGRSALKGDKIPDDLLVLSCDEDYSICVPFLEKGAAVYSSELLLNGIVTQKLEFERHRLFADHVKRTRSTIWLKQDSNHYLPVTRPK